MFRPGDRLSQGYNLLSTNDQHLLPDANTSLGVQTLIGVPKEQVQRCACQLSSLHADLAGQVGFNRQEPGH